MAQTFSNWNDVPKHLEAKVRKFWNGNGTATYDKSFDRNNEPITVYKLADYKVALNMDYLADAQKIKLFDLCSERSIILQSLLHSLSFEIETIRVHDEIYHLPGIVVGTWPHCNQFGGMDETGYIHT
jgi:hypothetical protein